MPLMKTSILFASRAVLRADVKFSRVTNQLKSRYLHNPGGISVEFCRKFSNQTTILRSNEVKYPESSLDCKEEEEEEEEESDEEENMYSREFVDMRVEDFKELYESDQTGAIKDQIDSILKEYEYHKYNSMGRVPSNIDVFDMDRILVEGQSPSNRLKMFNLFFKREMSRRNASKKKEREKILKRNELDEKYDKMEERYGAKSRTGLVAPNGELLYGLWHNSLFSRIPENRIKLSGTTERLVSAALFGRKVVFDFDFSDHMSVQAIRSSMEQVQEAYGVNRFHSEEPFDLWFCNFNADSMGGKFLANNSIRNLFDGSMVTVKNDCFTNYFDKRNLVYLTPDSRTPVDNIVKTEDVYIIGVYNDKGGKKPLTLRKAESMRIRSRCLPLDDHIAWQGGTKSLCMNHVLAILLEVYANGGDWRSALLKCLPKRKIKPLDLLKIEEEARRKRVKKKFNIRLDLDL